MTFFYGSEAQPKFAFGEGDHLKAFYKAMKHRLKGPHAMMKLFQDHWNPDAEYYTWTMPDMHTVHIPVMGTVDRRVEVTEANKLRFTYRSREVAAQRKGKALAANITHAIDAYVCRLVVKSCAKQGIPVAPIHDCFFAHPNHMNVVRRAYVDAMIDVDSKNMVQGILRQITGNRNYYFDKEASLANLIENSDYAIC